MIRIARGWTDGFRNVIRKCLPAASRVASALVDGIDVTDMRFQVAKIQLVTKSGFVLTVHAPFGLSNKGIVLILK